MINKNGVAVLIKHVNKVDGTIELEYVEVVKVKGRFAELANGRFIPTYKLWDSPYSAEKEFMKKCEKEYNEKAIRRAKYSLRLALAALEKAENHKRFYQKLRKNQAAATLLRLSIP